MPREIEYVVNQQLTHGRLGWAGLGEAGLGVAGRGMAGEDLEHQEWERRAARLATYDRQGGLCGACWEPLGSKETGTWEAHHRLRRGLMPTAYEWCPCDLVCLHPPCHAEAHSYPLRARERGLLLHMPDDPRQVPIEVQWPWEGPGFLSCDSSLVSPLIGSL